MEEINTYVQILFYAPKRKPGLQITHIKTHPMIVLDLQAFVRDENQRDLTHTFS